MHLVEAGRVAKAHAVHISWEAGPLEKKKTRRKETQYRSELPLVKG